METFWETSAKELYEKAHNLILQPNAKNPALKIPKGFKNDFFALVDRVNLSLMEDEDNFYGYFLLQMSREIRFDLSSPTAVNFKCAKYVLYFNPMLFLKLSRKQMESMLKHEILHILAMHLLRAKEYKSGYSTLAVNMAMDIVVNNYLDTLPPYAITLKWVNANYSLDLLPFQPFEYYVEKIQTALDLLEAEENAADDSNIDDSADDSANDDTAEDELEEIKKIAFDPEQSHKFWEESNYLDDQTLQDFTEQYIDKAQKSSLPKYLENLISALKKNQSGLPWNLYLKKMMGTVAGDKKKTITRRNRRQPARLDLRGELRSHKAKIAIALDISGSISDQEFNLAMKEVLAIVKNYNHEIMIIECDSEIRRVYKIKSAQDIKKRLNIRGSTRFTPVFEYANKNKINLLIYFTDGKGEERLLTRPKGYKTLWVISGSGDKLSLKEPCGAVKKLKNTVVEDEALTITMSDVKREGFSMNDMEEAHI
ncbi:MAG: VWA-like domain-containing protein [Desulfitobacteriia bacterium]|jgi:predicted metal-dependent peptidase